MPAEKPVVTRGARAKSPRMTRADKTQETRRKLIDAAAHVVGAEGYANASVAKITARAEVAQGTFYNYFASQQDLFDHLLPELGAQLLDLIRGRVAGVTASFEREQIGFRAFFDFLLERPEFYRILNEAETVSPKAYHEHMRNMAEGYLRALRRSHAKGELPGFDERELEVIVYVLLAARNYLSYRYVYHDGRVRPLPEWVERAYLKLVTGGVRHGGIDGRTYRPRPGTATVTATELGPSAYRYLPAPAGQATIELDVTASIRDADGAVRRAVLMDLLDAAGTRAALALAGERPKLLSLAASFRAPAVAPCLVASAAAHVGGGAVHVAAEIAGRGDQADTVATAQAIYAAAESKSTRRR